MRHNRIRNALLVSAFAAAGALAAAPAFAESSAYDGLWNVTVVTKSGSCQPTTSSTLVVTDGNVSAGGAAVSGKVGRGKSAICSMQPGTPARSVPSARISTAFCVGFI